MNWEIMLPVITLFLGVGLGFISNLFLEMFKQRQAVTGKVLDHFLKVREEVCGTISELASLKIGHELPKELITEKRIKISNLFYNHYDFLPKHVLQEMNCLYACLSDSQNRLFIIKDDNLMLLPESDMKEFIKSISVIKNFRFYAYIPLSSKNMNERRSARINYQARHTLKAINDELAIEKLVQWTRRLTK